jgi:hypothetical protein
MIPSVQNLVEDRLMYGSEERSGLLFSSVDLEVGVLRDHQLRAMLVIELNRL